MNNVGKWKMVWQMKLTNSIMHLSIPQCTSENKNMHISVLNGALWEMAQVYYGIWKICLLIKHHCLLKNCFSVHLGWVELWGFLWWAPSAKRKDHHGVSSGWSNVWHRSNTGLSSTQYEQIPILLGIWPFWLTPFFFRSITFWRAYG